MSEKTLPSPRAALTFMFITVLLSMIGFGIIMPILPQLLMEVTGENVSQAATYGGVLYFVYALAQFFMSPVMGGLSDRYGRRPVLLISLAFYALDFLLMALAPTYAWLVVARFLSGATSATYSTANAVIADISPPEKRSGNFGLIGAAFGLGFIIGPLVGGLFATIDVRAPFYAAAALGAMNFVFGFFFFPETNFKKRPFSLARANPFGSLWSVTRVRIVMVVLGAYFLMQFAHNSLPAVFSYFAVQKYGWSGLDIGFALAFVGVTAALVQGGLTRTLIPKIGEPRAVLIGATSMTISFIGYAFFAPTGMWIYVWIAVGALGGLMMPAMQGLMSSAIPADSQGELQGAIASVMSLTMMTSPLVMTRIFTEYTDSEGIVFPGAPLLLGGICIMASMIPFAVIVSRANRKEAQASPGVSA
ncbi:TCR/Tet family MFS transporter [Parvularcula sp. ZS-1/3]|uniref:TCR/Tet family MFS transporter n=1 Tax=Parvularcula mediterranea TaxID=2732508 RepID=A0A7Y3W3Z1_9PROT|nr:TCR/Tet family MFS transporter [Parvularcula mediterranea]NNU15245.1 TCR/Tet family MFS transporter [Parvularcula mediterranea]